MKSRAIVFVALVLLVTPLSFVKFGRRHRQHHHAPEPAAAPESPLDRLPR